MTIVLDTNVIVSGLLQPKGNPAQVLALALAGAVQVAHDERILAEYKEVLPRPRFKFDQEKIREVLTKLELDGVSIDATREQNLALPDPDDERRKGCVVVSPAEFMKAWRKANEEAG